MEQQIPSRRALYQMMVNVPHRKVLSAVGIFREALTQDPYMTSRACVYFNLPSSQFIIRDIQQVAIVTLLQTPVAAPYWREFREAGQCLLLGSDVYPDISIDNVPGLAPFMIFRTVDYIRRSDRRIPRRMAGVVLDYFRFLESDPARLDGVVIHNRRAMHDIWVHYKIRSRASGGELDRVHQMLFGTPPPDSRVAQMKVIAALDDPTEQAKAIVQAKIPYRVATGLIRSWTPAVGIAFVQAMSPDEARNSRRWVEQRGLLNFPEVREVYEGKIARSTSSVASIEHRASSQGEDAGVQAALNEASQKAIKREAIEGNVLLLVDKSGSMERAIEVAREFLYHVSRRVTGQVAVYAFDAYARHIPIPDITSKEAVRRAFSQITSGGATNAGAALNVALDEGFEPDKVVVVTDTGENRRPYLAEVAAEHLDPVTPITIIRVPGSTRGPMEETLAEAGFGVDIFDVTGEDYYVFDQVAALLSGKRRKSIIERILETELPHRQGRP